MDKIMQKKLFMDSEGNHYYQRNKGNDVFFQERIAADQVIIAAKFLALHPSSILEIGCSNGWRLEALRNIYGANCVGIDPSMQAIQEGMASYPNITLKQGTADQLPFDKDSFDLIIFGFCLYLCDRDDLFTIAREANRVLRNKGNIIILDFKSPFPYCNPYKHCANVFAYKMDYSNMFAWNPAYKIVSQITFDHQGKMQPDDVDESLSVVCLKKDNSTAYLMNPYGR
jgi:ubiquinone/menaquinone biosynthesis C-methylase UbiE